MALELKLAYDIGQIYGVLLSSDEAMHILSGIGFVAGSSYGLKALAMEVSNFVPFIGWAAKGAIAGSAIEAIGALLIGYFEVTYTSK